MLLIATTLVGQNLDFRSQFKAMGSAFEVVVVAPKDSAAWANKKLAFAENEIRRIEKVISSWDPASETSQVNANAGTQHTVVGDELWQLTKRSLAISALTEGAFDITYAGMATIWDFDKNKRKRWPDSATVTAALPLVNFENVWLQTDSTITLAKTGMRIGFGGIGKGYAADKVSLALRTQGVKSGVVNASGDLYAWGTDAKGEPWKTAIVDPTDKKKVKMWLAISGQAIVTSGDYEKYKVLNGKRYAHIINPKTGYPTTGIMSATVIAPKAELADALATSLFVLGVDKGLSLINRLTGVECIIIDDANKSWYSKNVETLIY